MADPDPPLSKPDQKDALAQSLSKGGSPPQRPFDGLWVSADGEGAARTEVGETAPYRTRHDGWTAARRRKFLHALARTGCVRDACAIAHISSTSAYRHRQRDPGFAREWEAALSEALPVLEAAAFERAVEGVWEPVVSGGKVAVYKKRYSDAILVTLLKRADEAAAAQLAGRGEVDPTEAFEELKRRLRKIHERMNEEGA